MDSAIKIRAAGEADLPALLHLYRQLDPEDAELSPSRAHVIWSEILNSKGVTSLLALSHGKPVASCMLMIVPNLTRGGRAFAFIENVITDRDYRRRGIGTAILNHAVDCAWKANCYKVVLTTRRSSDELFAFYEKAGFKRATRTAFEARSV
jgi:ribosomal protein S18 acetylase RimI-like enzyme